ncbi:MAG: ABC transporter permease [bacterium]|jgi:phospholipid/cholesterol/gamma-HCH transport system permease protein
MIIAWIRRLGALFLQLLERMGRTVTFLWTTLFWAVIPPFRFRQIVNRIRFIGVKSTLIIVLTGAFTGMALGLQLFHTLRRFGAESMLGPAIALSLLRELGPVLSALMVTGRAGSALAAEIGIMRLSEQIDALEAMALNPYRYLVVPNLIAGIIAFPLMASIFNVVGIYGGYLVGVKMLGLGPGVYWGEMQNLVDMKDILDGLYKSVSFGVIVTWICSYKGFFTGYGAEGVSRATTEGVVLSSVLILAWDYFLTSLMF